MGTKQGRIVVHLLAAFLAVFAFLACTRDVSAKKTDYSPVFNASYYAERYPDLKAAYGTNANRLLTHFLIFGMSEGRQASEDFNVDVYRNNYPDLRAAFGEDKKQYYLHYLNYGIKEGRSGKGTVQAAPQAGWRGIPGTDHPSYEQAAAVLDSLGWNLGSAFNWSANLTYYGHGKADMPETGDPGTRWFASFGFNNHKGNCFVMAATFYEFAKLCGYAPRQVVGYVPSARGGVTIHSWVEIDEGGQTYVYDPDFQYNKKNAVSGFKLQYGQKGTWRYQDYHQMHE